MKSALVSRVVMTTDVVLFLGGICIWCIGVFCCWREYGFSGAAWWGTGMALFLGGLFLDFPDWVYLPFLIGWIASWWMIPAQRERSRQEWENLCATLRAILVSVCVLVLKVTNALASVWREARRRSGQ